MKSGTSESREAIVIGSSAGGKQVLIQLLSALPSDFPLPVMICQHLHASDEGLYVQQLNECTELAVVEARDKQRIRGETVYVAPPNHHLLVERQRTLALSVDPKVCCSRPSIDVLFESAAYAFMTALVGILLSGTNDDGAGGLLTVRNLGGFTIAQDPATAEHPAMPQSAIELQAAHKVLAPAEIRDLVSGLQIGPASRRPT